MYFEISERKILLRLFDILFMLFSLYWVGFYFDLSYLKFSVIDLLNVTVLILYVNIFGAIFEMYNLQVASNEYQVLKSAVLTVSVTVFVYFLTPFYSPELPSNRLQILTFFGVIFISIILWRLFYVKFLASHRFAQNALLICDSEQVEELIQGLEKIDPHYKIIAFINNEGEGFNNFNLELDHKVDLVDANDLATFVKEKNVSEIVVATLKAERITTELYQQLMQLLESGTVIREYIQVYEHKTQRIPVKYVSRDFYRFFPFSSRNQNRLYLYIVRVLEIVFSSIGLLFSLVLLPLILLGNLLGNRGELFYTQERVGKDGKVFNIFKLRTMVHNAEANGAVFAAVNDSRVTAFGKFLRRTRIDEIPQFINILKGDMAVIGPRPERPFFVKELAERMPFYETRHIIKPGLTGWAQVNYSYGETLDDSLIKLQYDLYYIKNRSFYLDFNIALKTITTVLFYRGQ